MDLTHYQRNLPHRLPPGETIFLTIRLANSLPRIAQERLQADALLAEQAALTTGNDTLEGRYARQKRYFGSFDRLLDQASYGPRWLREPAVAAVVKEALHYPEPRMYQLVCYCLMPNHVHMLVSLPTNAPPLAATLQRLKSYSGLRANRLLERTGQFWQRESYDHVVRDAQEMQRIITYVLDNPVKAGLVADWQQWPHTYRQD